MCALRSKKSRAICERFAMIGRTGKARRPNTPKWWANWQTVDWIEGLLELAAEAERLANIADTGTGIPGAPDIGRDPLKLASHDERMEYGSKFEERLTLAHQIQQPGVPDQTALVWRIDLQRLLAELHRTRQRLRLAPRIYTKCPACNHDTLTINDHHLLCTWHECPNPTMIDNPRAMIRAAWLRGIKLAVSYGDNIVYCQGEQRERHWQKFLSEPITDAIRGDLQE